jgi:uncharacterized protein (TIGR03084 family)
MILPVIGNLLDDLQAESAELDATVAALTDEQWRLPTPADGWSIATQIAHLAWTDGAALAACTDAGAWAEYAAEAERDPNGFVDAGAVSLADRPPVELLAQWRQNRQRLGEALRGLPDGARIPWYGPPMGAASMATARFMETWAHGLDIADALGLRRQRTDRIRHVVHLGVRTCAFSFRLRGLEPPETPVYVELVAPSGETWTYGEPRADESVTGAAYDFALLVTQRRHRSELDLTAVGPFADRWLDVAQAFAGPPGPGRRPVSAGQKSPAARR